MITARRARAEDAAAWRALRIEALTHYPTAFLTTVAEAEARDVASYAEAIAAGHSFIAFDEETPIGIAALIPLTNRAQTRHRAEIGAVYIAESHHGTGAARILMQTIEDHAKGLGIWQLELFAEAQNTRAITFYERLGYSKAGRLPNAVIGPNGPADDVFLTKDLR
ncbi:MAG: GNAT family N-acetyltransferase [Pseudomonadota bacterium]